VGRSTCKECIDYYGKEKTPCGTCFPGVHSFNNNAIQVYIHCSNQYIIGPAGPIELDLSTVLKVCALLEIPSKEHMEIWSRIQKITSTLLDEQRRDAEVKAKAKKMRGGL